MKLLLSPHHMERLSSNEDTRQAEALFQAVLDIPFSSAAKLVFADFLEERGHDSYAFCFRWCAARGKHPLCSAKGLSCAWHRERLTRPPRRRAPLAAHVLPAVVYDQLSHAGPARWPAWLAFRRLAEALARLRDVLSLEDRP